MGKFAINLSVSYPLSADVAERNVTNDHNEILIFLRVLHPENQQSCLQENSAVRLQHSALPLLFLFVCLRYAVYEQFSFSCIYLHVSTHEGI